MSTEPRSIIYIDGFNLYYGAVRGGPHRWLNIQRYFTLLRQSDQIQRIYYFTARISGQNSANQEAYLRALGTLDLVEIRLGRFKSKTVRCTMPNCQHSGDRWFTVLEEKQTDVAIGIQMLEDAQDNACDRFVIVSGDSDLLPAVNAVKKRFPRKEIIVYIPARDKYRGAAAEMRNAADKDKTLPQVLLHKAQFPARLADGRGGWISKPSSW